MNPSLASESPEHWLFGGGRGALQVRYFANRRDEFLPHHRFELQRAGLPIPEETQATKVKFSTFFDTEAPGFYRTHYGALLSGAAHGGLVATIFRFKPVAANEPPSARWGATYDVKWAGFCGTYMALAFRGLLRASFVLDPKIREVWDEETKKVVKQAMDWLALSLDADWKEFPEKRDLLRACSSITGWNPLESA